MKKAKVRILTITSEHYEVYLNDVFMRALKTSFEAEVAAYKIVNRAVSDGYRVGGIEREGSPSLDEAIKLCKDTYCKLHKGG